MNSLRYPCDVSLIRLRLRSILLDIGSQLQRK